MGRIILYTITFISLAWITYVGFDIINKDNQFDATKLFGNADQSLLILQRLNESSISKCDFKTTTFNQKLVDKIEPWLSKEDLIFISEKRNHILIESKSNWNKDEVSKLFNNLKISIEHFSNKTFGCKAFRGQYNLNKIYIYKSKYKKSN